MARRRLDDREIEERLCGLPAWTLRDGRLHREYRFADFVAAFGFMASAALVAEAMNHHPDWTNVYAELRIDLWTHDAGGITEDDFTLAARLEQLAQGRTRS